MSNREVMQQALEALKESWHLTPMPDYARHSIKALRTALEQQQAEPVKEPYESPYNPNPVEYQYHYPDGSWSCSNGEVINGMHPDRARSLYALKDNT